MKHFLSKILNSNWLSDIEINDISEAELKIELNWDKKTLGGRASSIAGKAFICFSSLNDDEKGSDCVFVIKQ